VNGPSLRRIGEIGIRDVDAFTRRGAEILDDDPRLSRSVPADARTGVSAEKSPPPSDIDCSFYLRPTRTQRP